MIPPSYKSHNDLFEGFYTYRGTLPIRTRLPPNTSPRPYIGLRYGAKGVRFLISEVPLYGRETKDIKEQKKEATLLRREQKRLVL